MSRITAGTVAALAVVATIAGCSSQAVVQRADAQNTLHSIYVQSHARQAFNEMRQDGADLNWPATRRDALALRSDFAEMDARIHADRWPASFSQKVNSAERGLAAGERCLAAFASAPNLIDAAAIVSGSAACITMRHVMNGN